MPDWNAISHVVCILFVWVFFFSIIIHVISNIVTPIGIYHELKRSILHQRANGEPFHEKILRICYYNYLLSFPIFVVILITIRLTLPNEAITTAIEEYLIPALISIVILPTIRIIANPSELIKPSLCKFEKENDFFELHMANTQKIIRIWRNIRKKPKLSYDKSSKLNKKWKEKLIVRECVRIHKERFLSFLFAYISTGLILIGILYSYEIYRSTQIGDIVPNLTQYQLIMIIIFYFFSLFIATFLGELVLYLIPPIVQIPYKKK